MNLAVHVRSFGTQTLPRATPAFLEGNGAGAIICPLITTEVDSRPGPFEILAPLVRAEWTKSIAAGIFR